MKVKYDIIESIGVPSELVCSLRGVSRLKKGDIVFYFSNGFTGYSGKYYCMFGVFDRVRNSHLIFNHMLWSDIGGWKRMWPDEVPFNKESGYMAGPDKIFNKIFKLRRKKDMKRILLLLNI